MVKIIKDTDRWCPFAYLARRDGGMYNRNDDGTSLNECLGDGCMAYIEPKKGKQKGLCKLIEK